MELYRKVRLACRDGMSERAAARHFGVSRQSVRKMLQFSVPPGYRRTAPVRRPKLDEFTGLIEQWLEDDRRHGYRKQRHTAKRIFERLRDEHGFTGGYTIVKDYVREHRRHRREMFVPLTHPPGHAQADFGEAWAVIAGVKQKVHFFAFDLPQSDASYVRAYRAATAEAWVDGHVHVFSFFGAVALSIVYDNDRCLVSRIERDGTRRRTRLFSGFLSHYLIGDRYGRPGKGNDRGAVEGLVGWSRRATSWCRCRALRASRRSTGIWSSAAANDRATCCAGTERASRSAWSATSRRRARCRARRSMPVIKPRAR